MPVDRYEDEDEEHEEPRSSFATYVAEGDTLFKIGEYRKAVDSYTLALDVQPNDISCLVARSKCYLEMNEPMKALQDAEDSLSENGRFHRGLYRKAEALYRLGHFEYALMYYHRGQKLRPELDEFRLGIQKAQEAIENSIGDSANVKLENKGDLSFFSKQEDILNKKRPTFMKATVYSNRMKKHPSRHKEIKSPGPPPRTQKELLGELYSDKEYLEHLMNDGSLVNGPDNSHIHGLVQDGLQFLEKRTEFWRQQKPLYARENKGKSLPNKDSGTKKV